LNPAGNNLVSIKLQPDRRIFKAVADAAQFFRISINLLRGGFFMLRFSVLLVAALALIGATSITVSPASAYTGEAYNKCMAKCQATGSRHCTWWCERKH
jgi:hypothetical protein